jgi:lipopolysaccharide biosynthesis regulator YciM
MRKWIEVTVFLLGILFAMALSASRLQAQGCDDDEAMVLSYTKDLQGLVDTARKESLEQFEKSYHQRTGSTKLSLTLGMVKELEDCLDKAAHDPAATKEQTSASQSKHDKFAKLQGKVEQDQKVLKAAPEPKDAKATIERFDFSE